MTAKLNSQSRAEYPPNTVTCCHFSIGSLVFFAAEQAADCLAVSQSLRVRTLLGLISAAATIHPPAPDSAAAPPLMRFFFALGLLFLSPAFVLQLAFDPVTFSFASSRLLQAINLGCGMYAFTMILTSRQAINLALQCWPLLLQIGIAFASVAWSYDSAATFRNSTVFLITSMFGIAMAARVPPIACLRLIVRTMVLCCVLSIIWVFAFPELGVHQATDAFQFQHAGLWRGIFSHKQSLGVFAGLTTGLLLFYGSTAFPSTIINVGAMACSITCLVGTQSATGFLTAIFTSVMLYATYRIAKRPPQTRKTMMAMLALLMIVLYGCFHFGLFGFVATLIGKTADLSGRADAWPWVLTNFRNSGASLFGGGFMSGYSAVIAPTISIDNGYIDMLIEFGYLGAPLIFAIYGWIVWAGIRLIVTAPLASTAILIFPFNAMFVLLFVNITESNFMWKHISTVLVAVALCQIVRQKTATGGVAVAKWGSGKPPGRQQVAHARTQDSGAL